MCAILDNDVKHQVFISNDRLNSQNDSRPEAGREFFRWIDSGRGSLVVGGKLLWELAKTHSFREWMKAHLLSGSGRVRHVKDQEINDKTQTLKKAGSCQSDDEHVIALAQISGARLLYSNDMALGNDFRNKSLIDNPSGKVYTTRNDKSGRLRYDNTKFRHSHRELLKRNLCKT